MNREMIHRITTNPQRDCLDMANLSNDVNALVEYVESLEHRVEQFAKWRSELDVELCKAQTKILELKSELKHKIKIVKYKKGK